MDETNLSNVTEPRRARIVNPAALLPDAIRAMPILNQAIADSGVPAKTLGLVHMRTSQINGCAVCIDLHLQQHSKMSHGETLARLIALPAWRETPSFTDAERAALALAEHLARIADQGDPVPDAVWAEAARHYDDKALVGLVLHIGLVNLWNRFNLATRQVPGEVRW